MQKSLYDYCVERGDRTLLDQWDADRNGDLTPEEVSYGSKRRVWWQCSRGHRWQAVVYTRTSGENGCPYCGGKRPWPGENDLASQRPDLAAQWHPTKNAPVTPADVTVGSHHKAWWRCDQGHQWRAEVKSRALGGTGCPVCAGKVLLPGENDLATTHPALAEQWHPTKNGSLTPEQVMAGAGRRVWWQCGRGHQWQAAVATRAIGGAGCPVCAGKVILPGENDLASQFPDIAAQWDRERNGGLGPEQVSPYSNRKVWWRCPLGHGYQAAVGARDQQRQRLPLLRGAEGVARVQRSGHPGPGGGAAVAPHKKRPPDAGDGDGGEPPAGLVAVPQRPCVAGGGLFPGGAAAVRLSRLRREGQPGASGAVPGGHGGDGPQTGITSTYIERRNMK